MPGLGIAIPVGKDSLSMQAQWQDDEGIAPGGEPGDISGGAAAPVRDITKTLTPMLCAESETVLALLDWGEKTGALGGFILAQVTNQLSCVPDCQDPKRLARFFLYCLIESE